MNRKFITFSRIIRTGMVNFVRNAWLAMSAMAVMIITLTIVLFSIITNASFTNTIAQITDRIDVSVFLKDGVSEADGRQLAESVKGLPNVKEVQFLTKKEALAQYRKDNAAHPELANAFTEADNPLPITLHIKPIDLNKIQDIRDYLNRPVNTALWEKVSYSDDRKDAIDKIAKATDLLRRAGIIAVVVFATISILIIFNTIQMAIFNRRDELTIMRLLGASTGFIRGPFVVETVMYGVISALVSVLLIHGLFIASNSALQATSLGLLDINYSAQYFKENFLDLLVMQLAIGILIGAVSSTIATRRYLKFKSPK